MKKQYIITVIILFATILSSQTQNRINIVFIGNSITQGAMIEQPEKYAPPAHVAAMLRKKGFQVEIANHGVSGSTSVDHLPESGTIFPKVKASADKFMESGGELVFSISLGTNDSAIKGPNGAPVLKVQYLTNLGVITGELLKLYPNSKIVIHYPLWYSMNTYNSAMYLKDGLKRVISYRPMIDKLAESDSRIYRGDTLGFDFFEKNHLEFFFAEDGQAGTFYLHPNQKGVEKLAEFWSEAILKVIK